MSHVNFFSKPAESPDDVTVLLVAFTGTAAFNINGQTIHSAFSIFSTSLPYKPFGQDELNTLRIKYRSLQLLIIDEISMVDQNMLMYIHARLQQIIRTSHTIPFGNVAVLAVGDFHQIPPVKGKPLFKQDPGSLADLWSLFPICNLETVMRQKEDIAFAQILNRLRTHEKGQPIDPKDINVLESCIVSEIPNDAPFIAATRKQVELHNQKMLQYMNNIETIPAIDIYQTKCAVLKRLTKPSASAKIVLPVELSITEGARVILTSNLVVSDGLVNGVTGKVTKIIHGNRPNGQPEAVCILFDETRVGRQYRKQRPPPQNLDPATIVLKPHKEIYSFNLHHITRHQYPLKLAWALTIHKVQGMTLKKVTVSLEGIFKAGMPYVALSRVSSLQGLKMHGFQPRNIYCDTQVKNVLTLMLDCDVSCSNQLLHPSANKL
ncbi:ATP-dependent DNA helicase PIF1 [Holothuria leucospilota]|uniref:ATP-dependent DNA helicase n=1 Tax=Holothuria leucospilota TaxID=206669 RepID=A0A9Q1CD67_HOLLE|nr:ATP-dependent DNA helicase PIF1 [Holothuria leucospilota]